LLGQAISDERGVNIMTIREVLELRGEQRGIEKGMQQGMQEERFLIAKNLLATQQLSIDDIAQVTGLTLNQLESMQLESLDIEE
jgi:predicted transposase/invertase (TIGR01784 family)